MENTDKNQESLDIYRIYKLLKKTCIRTNRKNEDSYTINKKEIKMTIKIIRKKDILKN